MIDTETTTTEDFLAGLGRKVEMPDVTPELAAAATEWAKAYNGHFEFMLDMKAAACRKALSVGQAKGTLNCWRADVTRNRDPYLSKGQDLDVGIYVNDDGHIWKVQENRAKTNKYAKVWTDISGTRLTLSDEHVHGEWEYVAGGIRQVEGFRRMTLDEAKQFILVYGKCVRCGRVLKAAQSVEQGIGPVCIKYFGSFG